MNEIELQYVNHLSREQILEILKQAIKTYEQMPTDMNFYLIGRQSVYLTAKLAIEKEGLERVVESQKMAEAAKNLLNVNKFRS